MWDGVATARWIIDASLFLPCRSARPWISSSSEVALAHEVPTEMVSRVGGEDSDLEAIETLGECIFRAASCLGKPMGNDRSHQLSSVVIMLRSGTTKGRDTPRGRFQLIRVPLLILRRSTQPFKRLMHSISRASLFVPLQSNFRLETRSLLELDRNP